MVVFKLPFKQKYRTNVHVTNKQFLSQKGIKNHGQNYLYAGYWKVYHNLSDALTVFDKYDKARELIKGFIREGMELKEILKICEHIQNFQVLKQILLQTIQHGCFVK